MATDAVSHGLAEVAARLERSTVAVREQRGAGSGVVWTRDTIVTNAHVASAPELTVVASDGRTLRARLARRDASLDLALLHVDAEGLEPAAVRSSRDLRAGEVLVAAGNPHGARGFAAGIAHTRVHDGRRFIAADLRLAPGNSGGPLADAAGRVVGINAMVAGGVALAIPSDVVAGFAAASPRAERLGIRYTPGRARGAPALILLEVAEGSPAERVGLLAGDCVLAIDGRPVAHASIDASAPAVRFAIERGGRPLDIVVERGVERRAA